MRYMVMSGVIREEFLADTIEEANARARLGALNNDEASVWIEVSRYARSEEVTEVMLDSETYGVGHRVSLAESSNGDDASGSR